MLKALINFFNLIHIAMVEFTKGIIIAMVLIIFSNVVLRYVFNSGIIWSEEVALLIAVWFSFLAMSIGVKQGLHININILPEKRMPKLLTAAIEKLGYIVVFIVGIVMVTYGTTLVGFTMRSIMPATRWPSGVMYAVIPVSGVLMIWDALTAILGIDTHEEAVNRFLAGEGSLKEVFGGPNA